MKWESIESFTLEKVEEYKQDSKALVEIKPTPSFEAFRIMEEIWFLAERGVIEKRVFMHELVTPGIKKKYGMVWKFVFYTSPLIGIFNHPVGYSTCWIVNLHQERVYYVGEFNPE